VIRYYGGSIVTWGFSCIRGSWVLLYYGGSIVSWVIVGGFLLYFGCLMVFVGGFFCILGLLWVLGVVGL
jgi:uncharacterized membrane protein